MLTLINSQSVIRSPSPVNAATNAISSGSSVARRPVLGRTVQFQTDLSSSDLKVWPDIYLSVFLTAAVVAVLKSPQLRDDPACMLSQRASVGVAMST